MFSGQLIGVDVGGTKVAVATLEQDRVSESLVRATEASSSDELVDEIVAAVAEMRSESTVGGRGRRLVRGGAAARARHRDRAALRPPRPWRAHRDPPGPPRAARRAFAARRCSPAWSWPGATKASRPRGGRWSERDRERPDGAGESLCPGRRAATPDPTTLVIFGAGGDLAARKLLPAVYNLSLAGLLPDRFGMIGVSRRHDVPLVPTDGPRGDPGPLSHRVRRGRLAGTRAPAGVRPGDFGDPELFEALAERLKRRRRAPGRDPARLLPGRRSALLRPDRQGAGGGRPGRRRRSADPADDREAVRTRPRFGARAERRDASALRRVAGVPPRPLPRQGDGAEPPGAAVRERHLRADLEPSLRRPRPDHHGRGLGIGHRGRLLRLGRRASRRDPEPRHAAARAGGDGGARCASTPTRSATRR